jgi:hypothetical protein
MTRLFKKSRVMPWHDPTILNIFGVGPRHGVDGLNIPDRSEFINVIFN